MTHPEGLIESVRIIDPVTGDQQGYVHDFYEYEDAYGSPIYDKMRRGLALDAGLLPDVEVDRLVAVFAFREPDDEALKADTKAHIKAHPGFIAVAEALQYPIEYHR